MTPKDCCIQKPGKGRSSLMVEKEAIESAQEIPGTKVFQGGRLIYTSTEKDREIFLKHQAGS